MRSASLVLVALCGSALLAAAPPRLHPPEVLPDHPLPAWIIQTDAAPANPFDPSEIAVRVAVTGPSDRPRSVPAFYAQPYEHRRIPRGGRPADWFYPSGPGRWEVRLTPWESGRHTLQAFVRTGDLEQQSATLETNLVPLEGPAFVRVSAHDGRFFETADGRAFFPLGLNLAFIGPSQYLDLDRLTTAFGRLAENGANFARIWTGCEDWALAVEARRSAWGRSWDWRAPFQPVRGPAGYHASQLAIVLGGSHPSRQTLSPSQPVALRPTTAYQIAVLLRGRPGSTLTLTSPRRQLTFTLPSGADQGERSLTNSFTTGTDEWWLDDLALEHADPEALWLTGFDLREAAGGPNLLSEADPNAPPRGRYNQVDCALLDHVVAAATRHGIRLQLCLLTRDHYRFALRDPASTEYALAVRDAQHLLRYAVARWGASPQVFAWEYFNEMDPGAPTGRFHHELGSYLRQIDPWQHLRTTSGWGPAPAHWTHPDLDIADLHWYLRPTWGHLARDETAAVLDRAALLLRQATNRPTVLGEFGLADDQWRQSPHLNEDGEGVHVHNTLWASAFSGLSATASFWWWETFDRLNHYRHFRPLAAFTKGIPFNLGDLRATNFVTPEGCRVLAWQNTREIHGWIVHTNATWWNRVVEMRPTPPPSERSFMVHGLRPGACRLEWWNCWSGEILHQTSLEVHERPLQVRSPPFVYDLAFRILRR